ncbi:MAG: LPS export ABC transporter permease LptF [Deltaproteobacteria bacterium]|nr:LPS export ABC transporter permease LptF [Candidatus Anaeroferrophillacea bacterium]
MVPSILERYTMREIGRPIVGVAAVLVLIFAGYCTVLFLDDAVNGLLSPAAVGILIALKVCIALDVLLPVSLFLAVILALGRFHADRELLAMEAAGAGYWPVVKAVLVLGLLLAVIVGLVSGFVRPRAYEQMYRLKARGKNELNLAHIEARRFYELGAGRDGVFFAERVDDRDGLVHGVHVWLQEGFRRQVIQAQSAVQGVDPDTGDQVIEFHDGYHYDMDDAAGSCQVVSFRRLRRRITPALALGGAAAKLKALSTVRLALSGRPEEIAEVQWRRSTGVTTLLLALLGIPLSRTVPRRGKHARVTTAFVIFFIYYNVQLMARSWVEQQVVPAFPGLWWVPFLLACLTVSWLAPRLRAASAPRPTGSDAGGRG